MVTESDITMVAKNALTQALRSLITHIISDSNEGSNLNIPYLYPLLSTTVPTDVPKYTL